MTNVKICGLTRPEDAMLAASLGAWALGVILAPESPRFVDLEQAASLLDAGAAAAPAEIERVGVFVNAGIGEMEAAVRACGLTAVQLHGEESPEDCEQVRRRIGVKVIKALRVSGEDSLRGVVQFDTDLVLLDTYQPERRGGTGEVFDWSLAAALPEGLRSGRMILSGGLNPENVAEAVLAVHPFAVDTASGVESAPGVKDREKLVSFFKRLKGVNR
jgi:phosphoribosylanthranilate isomerase